MRKLILSIVALLCLSFAQAHAQIVQVKPVDEAQEVPSFASYRAEFLAAVTARDIPRVLEFVSPDVHLSFGGDVGHDAFVYFLTVPEDSLLSEYRDEAEDMREDYWNALTEVLRLGGQFEEGKTAFSAPYTWSLDIDLPEIYTPYETLFVMGTDVPLRKGRSGLSRVIARMDHEVLLLDWNELDGKKKRFLKVTRGDGQVGYVRADQVKSAVDYRARFERGDDGWTMVMFLAGD